MSNKGFVYMFAALCAFASLSSCTKEFGGAAPGEGIVFRASADYDNGPETKTAYSGYEYGGKERIDWVNGDRIRIASDKALTSEGARYSDYEVTGVRTGTGSSAAISYATVKNVKGAGLRWGSGTHKFYAVYPAPAAVNSSIEQSGNVVTMTLPQSQHQEAQMEYAYMYAAVQTAAEATVNLAFKPMFTAFQFTVRSETDASMTITSFSLSTGQNKAMAGTCRATITANSNSASSTAAFSNFTAYNASTGNNTITVDMGSGVTVTKTTYATITVFALPQDYSQLTASFTTSAGETKSLKLQNASGTWVNFSAGHKYNINGLGLPGEWTYTVSSIDDIIRTGEQVLYDYNKDVTVTLQRSRTGSATQNLPWKAYFTAASDPTAVVGASVQSSWSEVPLQDADGNDWLSLSAYSGNGDANSVKVSLAGNELPPSAIDLMVDAQAMTTAMSANNLGTIDVSRMKFNGSAFAYSPRNAANTANCYVINGYGTFYIPLVYGNGIQNGSPAQAYRGIAAENCLETFINADGNPITSDYILQDAGLTKSGQYEARIVWQDVEPGAQIIWDSDVSFVAAGSSELSGVAALNCAYLKFRVRQYQSQVSGRGIKPGNAVIALYDKGEDKILWSWHLWFTNEPFFTDDLHDGSRGLDSKTLLSCEMGWVPPISYLSTLIVSRQQKVVILDTSAKMVRLTFNVRQNDYTRPPVREDGYSRSVYQCGRMHPFLGLGGTYNKPRQGFSSSYIDRESIITSGVVMYPVKILESSDDKGVMIRNPHIAYRFTDQGDANLFCYANLWNANLDNYLLVPVKKTIYDPCPVGFKVSAPPGLSLGTAVKEFVRDDVRGVGYRYTLTFSQLEFLPSCSVSSFGVRDTGYGYFWASLPVTSKHGSYYVPIMNFFFNEDQFGLAQSNFFPPTARSRVRPACDYY